MHTRIPVLYITLCLIVISFLSGCLSRKPPVETVISPPLLAEYTVPNATINLARTKIVELPVLKDDLDGVRETTDITVLQNVQVATDYNYGRLRDAPIQVGSVGELLCVFNIRSYLLALDQAAGFEYEIGSFAGEDEHESTEHIDSVKLYWPEQKDSVVLYFQGETEGDIYFPAGMGLAVEETSTTAPNSTQAYPPDEYGNDLQDYVSIPPFDINNTPISIWFLKDGANYAGFLIGGHAEAQVCEVASLEVFNKMAVLDPEGLGVFSFGVGYHQRSAAITQQRYNELLGDMKEAFSNLKEEYPYQVSVNDIDEGQYNSYTEMLAAHMANAKDYPAWDTHVVEYKLKNHPLMLPFRKVSTGEAIYFDVPATKFGKIPTELAYASMATHLKGVEQLLDRIIAFNRERIDYVKELVVTNESYGWELDWGRVVKGMITSKDQLLEGHKPPPDGFVLIDQMTREERPITLREAMQALENPRVEKTPKVVRELTEWRKNSDAYLKGFAERKRALIMDIERDTEGVLAYRRKNTQQLADLATRKFDAHVIDAFLRGWVFGAGDDELNEKLDTWYENKRTQVWTSIMSDHPNLKVEGKLAGIFEIDDVFFAVQNKGQYFRITPYKLTGGEFLQVIDKTKDISYAVSPFNYRFKSTDDE